jgi:signal peptidase I
LALVPEQDRASSPVEPRPRAAGPRPTVEFLVVLAIGVLVARAFTAEAYIVPTGSMAPTLLGLHRDYVCPNCRYHFALGIDEAGRAGRPVCPNCGDAELGAASASDGNGDRLLVHKFLFDFRPPRRWEMAVFQNPSNPNEAYVKRVVGLPGEAIEIRKGDVYADDRIARKSLAEQTAIRVLVYDDDYRPRAGAREPRWVFRRGPRRRPIPSGWSAVGNGFIREPVGQGGGPVDWLEYHHVQPARGSSGPVRDFNAYNGIDLPGEYRVDDLMIEADVRADHPILVRLGGDDARFEVVVPFGGGRPRVRHDGKDVALRGGRDLSAGVKAGRLVASWFDRRLTLAIDGRLLFEPIDLDGPTGAGPPGAVAPALGVVGPGRIEVRSLKLYRDIYYTDALAGAPRRPFGVGVPYRLGPGEYFVLGDNSAVSNDSRFWPGSPVVSADRLLGKPFLVHLPSRAVPLRVFGREIYWIPDPRGIRYIR